MRLNRVRVVVFLAILACFLGFGFSTLRAQAPATEAPPPTIRVSTHLVLVNVVVTDKKGGPVTGLKKDDFTVEEKGKKQKIAFFSNPEPTKQAEVPELAPGVYTNKPEFRAPAGPVTAILLDAANTPFQDQAYARLQMLKYVQDQLKPGQRIGIFTLTDSLGVLQDFTEDSSLLLEALKKYKPVVQPQATVAAPLSAGAGEALRSGVQGTIDSIQSAAAAFQSAQVNYNLDRRVVVTLSGMRSLGRILSGIPGRKEIVWLTAAFPFDLVPENRNISEAELMADLPNIDVRTKDVDTRAAGAVAETQRGSYAQAIREVAAELASSQIAIYPVDVRGLASGMEFQREDSANRQGSSISDRAFTRMSDVTASQETMRAIAEETGGKVYVNQNDIKTGVALALDDNNASYTIGYYPENKKWDGNYRTIKVKLSRDGTELNYRRGYFAIDPTQVKEKDRKPEQEVASALADVLPDTQVTFSSRVKTEEKGKVGVDFLVDPNTVSAEDSSGGKKLDVAFYAVMFSKDGKMVANRSMKVDQAFKEDVYAQLLKQGMLLHMDMDANPSATKLHLLVRDNRTGYIGSLIVPLNPH
jgi:VWFA-related protein